MTKRNAVRPRHARGSRTNDATSNERTTSNKKHVGDRRHGTDVSHACLCGFEYRVPRWLPWCVVIATMTSRIWYVTSDKSLWILHPDEIYQSVEVAFSEVYGYGFRPYEYLPPPMNLTSSADNQTVKSGMYALRSFLYPNIFTMVLRVTKLLGADHDPFMICRVFNVIITSLLPVSVHMFTARIFSCRLLALLTCAFSALQLHLAVFATHTIVNSFTSPFVFYGLCLCLPVSDINSVLHPRSKHTRVSPGAQQEPHSQIKDKTTSDRKHHFGEHDSTSGYSSTSSNDRSPAETAAKKIFQFDNINKETNTNKHVEQKTKSCRNLNRGSIDSEYSFNGFVEAFFGGLLLGLVCYIRVDTVLICSVLYCGLLVTSPGNMWNSIKMSFSSVFGGFTGLTCGVIYDAIRYDINAISPVQWFKFNILSNKAQTLYAALNSQSYFLEFIATPFYVAVAMLMVACSVYVGIYKPVLPKVQLHRHCAMFVCLFLVTGVYSCAGHSELRFIHNVFVLYAICIAMTLHILFIILRKNLSKSAICLVLVINAIDTWRYFPEINSPVIDKLTYGKASVSRDLNVCLRRLSQTNDVTGVFIDGDIYNIAGFARLKHDVPVLVRVYNELHFYHARKHNNFGLPSGIRVVNDFSDIFHKSNTAYLSKLLQEEDAINYIVSRRKPPFVKTDDFDFRLVVQCGEKFKIYTRVLTAKQIHEMHAAAKGIPVGLQSSVLTYESNWLITRGLYNKAKERSEAALKLDRPTARLFQQLLFCCFKNGQKREVLRYEKECVRMFGKEECAKPQPKIVLHDEYRRFDL